MRDWLSTQFQPFWQARSKREQYLLVIMVGVLMVVVGWLGLSLPLKDTVRKNREAVLRLDAERVYLSVLESELSQLKKQPVVTVLKAHELLSLLKEVMGNVGFDDSTLTLSQEGPDAVRILGEVQFDAWISLVAQLAQFHQVRIVRYSASATSTPGQVKLDAVLVHAGGSA